jgi:hypothetical protein
VSEVGFEILLKVIGFAHVFKNGEKVLSSVISVFFCVSCVFFNV